MVNVVAITACVVSMVCQWQMAKGHLRSGFVLGIVNGILLAILNGLMALDNPGVAFLIVPSFWMIFASFVGLRRLKEAKC